MYSDEMFAAQREWASRGLLTARDLLALMAPVGQYSEFSRSESETIGFLLTATARASESALLLCAYGQLWDAEIVTRSALEGTLKFAYLVQSRDTFADRHREYAEDLFAIALLKDHRKASELLASQQDAEHPEWRPIRDRLLSDEKVAELSARFSRECRRNLETLWGFTGLLSTLSRSNDPLFRGLGGLPHSYSLASHVNHLDYVGASLPFDRDKRSPNRKESIHFAHHGRLVSDVLTFLHFRLLVGYRFVEADMTPLRKAKRQIDKLHEEYEQANANWMKVEYGDTGT